MTGSSVPQEAVEQSQDRPFAALVLDAKAVAQITGSFSLTWPALVQRNPTAAKGRLLEVHWRVQAGAESVDLR